ncbi:DUF2786 domain-containing protein [Snodgrassella alvi]|uniref:DUF2786 domain-containing protein n=1 Tax=Snodgrassella alvi TaxID=1196083 RepID=UPI00351BEF0B
MNKSQAIEKIKKCLRLSKSANEHEAAQALKQAQILMQKFGITDIDVHLSEINESSLNVPTAMPKWQHSLFAVCRRAFGVDGYIRMGFCASKGKKTAQYRFYGISPKPELAAYAYEVILRQLRAARQKYMKEELSRVKLSKNKIYRADNFCEGWVRGVSSMVNKFAISESEQLQLEAYRGKLNLNGNAKTRTVNPSQSVKRNNGIDYQEGFMQGKDAQLNHGVNGAENDRIKRIGGEHA